MSSEPKSAAAGSTPAKVACRPYVSAHADLIALLPSPGESWTRFDLAETDAAAVLVEHFPSVAQPLKAHGVLNRQRITHAGGTDMVVWQTNAPSYRLAEQLRAQRQQLPCGHRSGFDTIERGRYRCGFRWCDAEYGREAVAEVFG